MSLPHTGRLSAEVDGIQCTFDGDVWEAAGDPRLSVALDRATAGVPKTHRTIVEVAQAAMAAAGFASRSRILSWEIGDWGEELPDGAID